MSTTRIRPDSPRCQPGYKPLPREAWLKTQVIIITADWPAESRANLFEAVIDALDEAYTAGQQAAKTREVVG